MQISFHGAAGCVTGSCHLVSGGGRKILVDCGMFQGGHELHEDNAAPFGFDAAEIDVLLLTHAHLDHCGRIPLLVKRGFKGEIICTAATRELARLVLLDSAHLHEEEARRRSRHRSGVADEAPLYNTMDALDSFDSFGRTAAYGETIELSPGMRATFYDAGHILGSASILLEVNESGRWRRIVFSGDIGPRHRLFLGEPEPPPHADVVVMETTYGDRDHRPLDATLAEFNEAICDAHQRGGNIIIPTFALERAQELLFAIRRGMTDDVLPSSMHVFLDSPMAISATEIFRRHREGMKPEAAARLRHGEDLFKPPNLHLTREASDSMDLNRIRSGAIILAGSGMCTGGRVRHHLRHNLPHSDCSIIFVGFAAEGTLARIIIDGARSVKLFGDMVPVRARIHTINGFSSHAGATELLEWWRRTGPPETTFLVHGEPRPMTALAAKMGDTHVIRPPMHATSTL